MAEEPFPRPRKRRSTAARGKLRRGQNVESVVVEEAFSLSLPTNAPSSLRTEQNGNHAGDGCYISATVHNNRYYGVLIEQSALKTASLLHFQDEASSLDLNRRMKMLQDSQLVNNPKEGIEDRKRPAEPSNVESQPDVKRVKLESESLAKPAAAALPRTIQKFRYVDSAGDLPGYRILLATYASVEAASEDDFEKERKIEEACQAGGGFIGKYYFQYEVVNNALETSKLDKPTDIGMRTSLGFERFLSHTELPTWFPLRNLQTGQTKVLNMLHMKKGKGDSVVWDDSATKIDIDTTGTHIPMEHRSRYRVGILGAGISGLACASELLLQAERDNIDLEVVLLEGRSRVGGRLYTDESTFKCDDGATPFPVDLGASWIHGISHNPLAELAKEAGVNFVTSSEEVKMLTENMGNVDPVVDERIGNLFDELLDQAAEYCWEQEDYVPDEQRNQKAVRWYASVLGPDSNPEKASTPAAIDAPPHRSSSDVSIDHAIGKVIAKNSQKKFSKLSKIEKNLLLWNVLNINYALGANISALSMRYWDSDDSHAFEGDHVLLKEGYSQIIRYMLNGLMAKGDRFQLIQSCPIGTVEYARKSTTLPYPGQDSRGRKMADLSDSCCVTSRDGNQSYKFDFLVSTLPLGVLKESIALDQAPGNGTGVSFQPPLPFTKRDSIESVGFGLLNKVYLQFPRPFWRVSSVLPDGQILFGNASGVNPEHYMFYDIGKSLGTEGYSPAILMTLISGEEAVASERLSDEDLVGRVLQTLRVLFSRETVPEPLASKTTRWGGDEFARGCYTFLPPGTSDQDFQILQSPINGNGDSLVLDGSETMRLFWAGEHTTSLHPSMAHGAMLSGIRAAREVISTIQFQHLGGQTSIDKLIPMAIFRKQNPGMTLQCNLCNLHGSRAKEGSLLAFQRGARQVLAHNNCAENSPEVEVADGQWKNVIKAVNRGKHIECTLCGQKGATVGCTHPNCFKSHHFSCAEEGGWRFERDGKVFFCDMHRGKKRDIAPSVCDQVSMRFFRSRFSSMPLICSLCGAEGDHERAGALLAFQQKNRHVLIHDNCARYTTIVGTVEQNGDGDDQFRNLLDAVSLAKSCTRCKWRGATIECADPSCQACFHYTCAEDSGWKFKRDGKQFRCHRHNGSQIEKVTVDPAPVAVNATTVVAPVPNGAQKPDSDTDFNATGKSFNHKSDKEPESTAGSTSRFDLKPATALATNGSTAPETAVNDNSSLFQHNLFCIGGNTVLNGDAMTGTSSSQPSNAKIDGLVLDAKGISKIPVSNTLNDKDEDSSDDALASDEESEIDVMVRPLPQVPPTSDGDEQVVRVSRSTVFEPWNFFFGVISGASPAKPPILIIEVDKDGPSGLQDDDIVTSVNNIKLGSPGAVNLQEILSMLREATSLEIGVRRARSKTAAAPDNEANLN